MPALAEPVGSELGLAIAGEEALLVALDAQQALAGREVGEVPHLFAHHAGELVKCLEVLLVVIDLVLLRVHYGRGVVHTGDRVGSKVCGPSALRTFARAFQGK